MSAIDGTGIVLTDHAIVLASVLGAAVGSFVLGLVGLMCGSTNEVRIARRAVLWVRIACVFEVLAWICVLATEIRQPRIRRIEWPHFGLLLPPLAISVTFVALFVNSHPIFRWVALLSQPFFVSTSGMASATVWLRTQCLQSGECLARPSEALSEIEVWVLLVSYLLAGFCATQVILLTGYLQAALGACGLRYPARLLSTSAGAGGIVMEDPNDKHLQEKGLHPGGGVSGSRHAAVGASAVKLESSTARRRGKGADGGAAAGDGAMRANRADLGRA